ncbi:von Willebrand factor A domain-containing protein 5A isoform X2 [Cherax quadricarinatus]|uniref:von Willebrand factor A domain-containing protein 5A isoform X2 n=1 Tax=Cherax quadricarinatus TaxID=27406 RepID=UPI00387E4940
MAFVKILPVPRWGLLGYCLIKTDVIQLVDLECVSTQVTIRGFVAQVNAKLTYHNSSSEALQVHYRLPVDESAAVYKFEARLDGRIIYTQCMEKKKAEKVYKEAVSAGKTAVLARQDENASDVLHLNLGNLPAGSKAELTISLVMELKVQVDGGVKFVLPTVLNPRYSPSLITDVSAPGFGSDVHIARIVTVPKAYVIDIKCDITGGHDIGRVISHTDSLNVAISDDLKSAQVTQDGGFKSDHDWSLLIYYANPYKTHIIRETGDRSTTGLMKDDLIMLNLFPEVPSKSYSNKNEIIFVIDRSGSMGGEKIQSARATLLLFLKSLPIGCFFNIISFGSDFCSLFPAGSCEYNEETLARACELQRNLYADMGGTEILRPFHSIYSKPPKPGYSRQILLISDGEVWNVDQVTQLVGRHVHETRVFAVGIGDGASTALIHGVARAGKGYSEMVFQQDKLQHKVMGLVNSMVQESVQDVRVTCEVEPTSRVTLLPKVPPVIFGGQHLVLYTRLPPTTTVKEISIKGNIGSAELSISIQGSDIVMVHDTEMSLHRLAARAQINQWQLDEEEDVADDMITLSVSSGVVSKLTALVGVDQEGNQIEQSHLKDIHTFMNANLGTSWGTARSAMYTPACAQMMSSPPPRGCRVGFSFQLGGSQIPGVSLSSQGGGQQTFGFGSSSQGGGFFGSSSQGGGLIDSSRQGGGQQTSGFGSSGQGGGLFGSSSQEGGVFGSSSQGGGQQTFGFGSSSQGGGQQTFDSKSQGDDPLLLSFSSSTGGPQPCSFGSSMGSPQTIGSESQGSGPQPFRFGSNMGGLQTLVSENQGSGPQAFRFGSSMGGLQTLGSENQGSGPQAFRFGSSMGDPQTLVSENEKNGPQTLGSKSQGSGPHAFSFGSTSQGSSPQGFGSSSQQDGLQTLSCQQEHMEVEFDSSNGGSADNLEDLKSGSGVHLLQIVNLQKFDGSWTLPDVAKLCSVSLAQLQDKKPSQNENAWATAVALALLENKFDAVRDEWSLLANKARLYISNSGEDVEALLKAAQTFLATQQQ